MKTSHKMALVAASALAGAIMTAALAATGRARMAPGAGAAAQGGDAMRMARSGEQG